MCRMASDPSQFDPGVVPVDTTLTCPSNKPCNTSMSQFRQLHVYLQAKMSSITSQAMVCKQKFQVLTSSTWAKVFQVYKAFHQRLGFFKCRQTRTTSVAYYILTEISTGILLLLPSQQLKSQLLLLSSLVVPPALSNQIEV
jgi:hypothetical protein